MRLQREPTIGLVLEETDRAKLRRLFDAFALAVKLPDGRGDAWWRIVVQLSVRGGSRGMQQIEQDPECLDRVRDSVSLQRCLAARTPKRFIEKALREHGATRFPTKVAGDLVALLRDPRVVDGGRVVLDDGLRGLRDGDAMRDAVIARTSGLFGMKSASDYLINRGLTTDVIALDRRVVGVLREHFGLEVPLAYIQGKSEVYRAVEDGLRRECAAIGMSLAVLDRILYQYSVMSAVEWVMR